MTERAGEETRPKNPPEPTTSDRPHWYYHCSEPCSSKSLENPGPRKRKARDVKADGRPSDGGGDKSEAHGAKKEVREDIIEKLLRIKHYRMYETLCENRKISIGFTSDMTAAELVMLSDLTKKFNVPVKNVWDDTITHLVVDNVYGGVCIRRTTMYINAIVSHCFIISIKWVKECLRSGFLVPEFDYMVCNKYGEPSALDSWSAGRGVIESPMKWSTNCILFFYNFDVSNMKHVINTVNWSRKVGFVIAENIEELGNEKYGLRCVIANQLVRRSEQPAETEMLIWLVQYKAITVALDWLLKCLYQYKFNPIEKVYQVLELDYDMIEHVNAFGYVRH